MENPAILLIESDEVEFQRLASLWRAQEFSVRVHWARGVGDAIAYLRGVDGYDDRRFFPEPDLVLFNAALPLEAAKETIIWMLAHEDFRRVPLLVLSNSDEPTQVARVMTAGVAGCFRRPDSADRLRGLLAGIVAHWRKGPIGRHAPWPGAVEIAASCAA